MFTKNLKKYLNLFVSLFLAFVIGSGIIGLWSRLRSNITIMSTTSRMTTIPPTKLHNNEYNQQGYSDTTYIVAQEWVQPAGWQQNHLQSYTMKTTSVAAMISPTNLHDENNKWENNTNYKITANTNNKYDQQNDNNATYEVAQ